MPVVGGLVGLALALIGTPVSLSLALVRPALGLVVIIGMSRGAEGEQAQTHGDDDDQRDEGVETTQVVFDFSVVPQVELIRRVLIWRRVGLLSVVIAASPVGQI